MHGLELEQLAVDGCTTKAPCGGQVAGPSPVDRRKQGLKRSVAVEAGHPPGGGTSDVAITGRSPAIDEGSSPARVDPHERR
jgi:hypothetical protein